MKEFYVKEKVEWKDLPVGEVFAFNGCWTIGYKIDINKAMVLSCDDIHWDEDESGKIFIIRNDWNGIHSFYADGAGSLYNPFSKKALYKLPKSIQKLYLVE